MRELDTIYADWYVKPEMAGHSLAKKSVSMVQELIDKYGKTSEQKELIEFVFDFENDDWHYWWNITKKYVGLIRYVLRRIGKATWMSLLFHHNQCSGLLKSPMTWYLEIQSYKFEFDPYFKNYMIGLSLYGVTSWSICMDRYIKYHNDLCDKHGVTFDCDELCDTV